MTHVVGETLRTAFAAWRDAVSNRAPLKPAALAFRDAAPKAPIFPDPQAAVAAIRAEPDDLRRGALSVLAAAAGADAFAAESGWNADDVTDVSALLLHAMFVRGDAPRERRLLAGATLHRDAGVRLAAIECRIRFARRVGLDRDGLAALLGAAFREDGSTRAIRQGAADLIWKLGAHDLIGPLFGRFPRMAAKGADDPVVARLLAGAPDRFTPQSKSAQAAALAEKLLGVERATAAFWTRLADPALRIAVVGNSPCDTGRGRGAEIDGHDLVVRFNDAPEDGRFAADYGARCDAKAFAVTKVVNGQTATAAPTVVFSSQSHVAARGMAFVDELAARGKTVVYAPATVNMSLRAALGAAPSTGLVVLSHLRAVRGSLASVSVFGFALTDQLTPGFVQHYFGTEPGAPVNHDWRAERIILDGWLAGG